MLFNGSTSQTVEKLNSNLQVSASDRKRSENNENNLYVNLLYMCFNDLKVNVKKKLCLKYVRNNLKIKLENSNFGFDFAF